MNFSKLSVTKSSQAIPVDLVMSFILMLAEVSGVELRVPRDNRARSRDVAGIIQNHVLGESRYIIF